MKNKLYKLSGYMFLLSGAVMIAAAGYDLTHPGSEKFWIPNLIMWASMGLNKLLAPRGWNYYTASNKEENYC